MRGDKPGEQFFLIMPFPISYPSNFHSIETDLQLKRKAVGTTGTLEISKEVLFFHYDKYKNLRR